jgi:hypothetical protein
MNQLVHSIHEVLAGVGASLYLAMWIKGTWNVNANTASWWINQDDWELSLEAVQQVQQELGQWTIDHFADHINAKASRFNSIFFVPGTEAINTFSQSWQGEINLLMPPFYFILQVLQHLIKHRAVGILVCPRWEAQPWWPLLLHITVQVISLGAGSRATTVGPSGMCEPARGQWSMEARLVSGALFHQWRS